MQPVFVVLTDLSQAAEAALTYAARLALPLGGRLVLLHVYQDPLLEPESAMMTMSLVMQSRQQIKIDLLRRAQQLAVPTEVEVSVDTLAATLPDVVRRHHPLAFVLGREQPESLLDRLLPHEAAPILRAAHYPLLLVPETWTDVAPPRRVVVATDDQRFWLTTPSLAVGGLLNWLRPTTTVVHTAPHDGPSAAGVGLEAVRRTGLFGELSNNSLYEVRQEAPADGILHAADDLHAQLVVVFARPHTFLGGLFHRSVTAQLLRRSPRPVLVLPTSA